MSENVDKIKDLILEAAEKAKKDTAGEPAPETPQKLEWPIQATLGPGLEGAIACETNVGYVNGAKGWLVYRGYDIFDLAANCTYEETAYLLLHGELPNPQQLNLFNLNPWA